MPVLSYQVNAPGYGGINPKLVYIFTDDPVSVITATGYIDWLANQQGIYTGDVALIVSRQTPTSVFAANFYEFQRVGNGPHWDLIPESGSALVQSVSGTLNQIIASPTTGNVVVSISPNPIIPGTGSVNLPVGNTAQRAGAAGSIRFNSQLDQFEVTMDGVTWIALQTGSPSAVTSIAGTANEIAASSPTGNVVISIVNNPVIPGTAEITLPTGNTAQRGSTAGSIRFNNQLDVFETTVDGSTWLPIQTGTPGSVTDIIGTANEINASSPTGSVTLTIANNAVMPGNAELTLPTGNTAQRGSTAGSIRFNSQLDVFETTVDGTTWLPIQTGSPGAVTSIFGTTNEITASSSTGNVTLAIANNAVLPGTAEVVLPVGSTAQRGSTAGGLRLNNQLNAIELTNDGTNWYTISTSNNTVNSVSGTTNRITVTGTNNAVVDIAATYVGQTSITTLGTVTTGTWNATPVTVPFGGTGNTSFTAYAVICGGTTSTGALQAIASLGSSGQVLTSNGAGALPTWQASGGGGGAGARFWAKISGDGTTVLGSFNISSLTDVGTGQITVGFTTPFSDSNWCQLLSVAPGSVSDNIYYSGGINTNNASAINRRTSGATIDPGTWFMAGFGNQ